MPILTCVLIAVGAYLLGSVPTGFLVARARGVDIRTVGSGNIGATNTFRVLGVGPGVFVLLMDALKGWLAVKALAVWIVGALATQSSPAVSAEWTAIIAAVCAVLGHNYTCWLHFKGGKGIATSAGVLLALVPWALLVIFVVWLLLFLLTRYVSVASIAASATLPFATWFTTGSLALTGVTGALSVLAIAKHRRNIQRLMDGTENRVQFKKKEAAS